MRTKILAKVSVFSFLVIFTCLMGCNTTQQRIAANTIASLDVSATGAVDGYYAAAIKGIAPTNGIPTVSKAYNQFHKDLLVAIDLAQNNTNALAPDNLTQEAADVLAAVAAVFPPAVPKNHIVSTNKLTP